MSRLRVSACLALVLAILGCSKSSSGRSGGSPPPPGTFSEVFAWGDNSYGQLGDGTQSDRSTPVRVQDPTDPSGFLTGVHDIGAAAEVSLALTADGTVLSWGRNDQGQLGTGTSLPGGRSFPGLVEDPSDSTGYLQNVEEISEGGHTTLVRLSDGTLLAWGSNIWGQVGDGTTVDRFWPVPVVDATGAFGGVVGLGRGSGGYKIVLRSGGTCWGWGHNDVGHCGVGNTTDPLLVPTQTVDNSDPSGFLTGITQLSLAAGHSLALKPDGTVRAWGWNFAGQVGNNSTSTRTSAVQVVDPGDPTGYLQGVIQVEGGGNTSYALKGDGTVWAWGRGDSGQLGNPSAGSGSLIPVQVEDPSDPSGYLRNVTAISCNGNAGLGWCLALKADGSVWAWGGNGNGQLGDGTQTDRTTPVRVVDTNDSSGYLTGIKAIQAGFEHAMAAR